MGSSPDLSVVVGVICGSSGVVESASSMKVKKNDDHSRAFRVSASEGRDRIKTRPNRAILVWEECGGENVQ